MLKILLSPAKSISKDQITFGNPTQPIFEQKAMVLASLLKGFKPEELSQLMSISPALADLNWSRFQDWKPLHTNAMPIQPAFQRGQILPGRRRGPAGRSPRP